MSNKEAALVLMYRYIFIFIHRDVGSSMFEKFEGVSGVNTRRMDISIDCLKLMLPNKIFNYYHSHSSFTHPKPLIASNLSNQRQST